MEKNMKKIRNFSEMSFVLGMIILPLGATLMAKADMGISMVIAPAYLLSLKFDFLTFGTAEFLLQTALIIVMSILSKKVKLGYISSFITAIIYGVILDLWMALFSLVTPTLFLRLVFYFVGMFVSSLGVALFFRTYLPPCAYDYFVREISHNFKIPTHRFKLAYDITSCIVSVILSFVFFAGINGIGWGTVLCAFVNGFIIDLFGKILDKFIDFSPRFHFEKYFS